MIYTKVFIGKILWCGIFFETFQETEVLVVEDRL
jgi:hypothetical protein